MIERYKKKKKLKRLKKMAILTIHKIIHYLLYFIHGTWKLPIKTKSLMLISVTETGIYHNHRPLFCQHAFWNQPFNKVQEVQRTSYRAVIGN
jgi:hypothetical protein